MSDIPGSLIADRPSCIEGRDGKARRADVAHPDAGHLAGRLLVEVGPGDPACRDEYFAPVHTTAGVGSGIDVVRNGYPLPVPERSVVTGPFRPFPRSVLHGEPSLFPKPPWFSGSWSVTQTGRRLTRYAAFRA